MVAVNDALQIVESGRTTLETALELFDFLEPVNLAFMTGRWRGTGLHTGHPMDGLLEASDWYGKEFINPETVHPLLFIDKNTGEIFKVKPNLTAMRWVLNFSIDPATNPWLGSALKLTRSLLKTEESQARLRMMECRGKVTATMIYDALPIADSFKKVDDDRVLGLMDFKYSNRPFFFVLKRDRG